jgi:hypothetical protein
MLAPEGGYSAGRGLFYVEDPMGGLSPEVKSLVYAHVRPTLNPPERRGGPADLVCAALAGTHEASVFVQPCLPTRVGSPRDFQLWLLKTGPLM